MEKENIFEVLSDKIFTDREEVLNYFWELIKEYIPRYVIANTVLIAHRRQGKTEIFHRLYNKAFWEQEKVVPIYYTFEEANFETVNFSNQYFRNFVRQYIAFKEKDLEFLERDISSEEILEYASSKGNRGLERLTKKYLSGKHDAWFLKTAIQGPRTVADLNKERILVMLDEFHNVKRIRNKDGTDPNALGYYQYGVESWICPHFITGSAVTMMLNEIVGSGALYGRFHYYRMGGLKHTDGEVLAKKLAKEFGVKIGEGIGTILSEKVGGNPFYITCVIQSAKKLSRNIYTIEDVDELFCYDVTNGGIWAEVMNHLANTVLQINEKWVTEQVLEATLDLIEERKQEPYPKNLVFADDVYKKLGKTYEYERVYNILQKLAGVDILEDRGGAYSDIKEKAVAKALETWHKHFRKKEPLNDVMERFFKESKEFRGWYGDFKGYVAELILEILFEKMKRKKIEGKYLHNISNLEVEVPDFVILRRRERYKDKNGRLCEIDLIGKRLEHFWAVDLKWMEEKVGLTTIKELERKVEVALEQYKDDIQNKEETVKLWFLSKSGFTSEAENYLHNKGYYYSTEPEIQALLKKFGMREIKV